MKNAGISIICCILSLVIAVLITVPKNKEENNLNIKKEISVLLTNENKIVKMDINQYVLCVLRGEMPADFEEQALMAQAVAIRTYIAKKMNFVNDKHPEACVCTDYAHCMAYVDENDARKNWGNKFEEYNKKLNKAVNETKILIMTYKGEPISAVFHAISSGKTENSNDVWSGGEVPYLKSVDSIEDTNVEGYLSETKVSLNEFYNKLGIENIGDIEYEHTEGGSVKNIIIGNEKFKGTEIRTLFNLRSANFTIKFEDEVVVFKVKGYGHGVGLSQRGANECAKNGMNYIDILKKYYKGIEIVNIE